MRRRPPLPPSRPGETGRREERLIALFALGCVLFSPLVLHVFVNAMPTIAGLPPLFLYLYGAWAALIAAVAFVVEGADEARQDPGDGAARSDRDPRR